MPEFIDTHAHWFLPEFDTDRSNALNEAANAGVKAIINANVDLSTTEALHKLLGEKAELQLYAAMGLHPCSVKENWENELDIIFSEFEKQSFVAVGEAGIDLYWDKSTLNLQLKAFEAQIQFAISKDLPIIIHSRNSMNEVMSLCRKYKNLRGVFHCYPGNSEQARQITAQGFFLGIGGVVTYKNSGLQKVVKDIPLEFLLLETDAPYLTPAPHRGKRNSSAYLVHIAEKIAEIKEISVEEVANATTTNAKRLFGLG